MDVDIAREAWKVYRFDDGIVVRVVYSYRSVEERATRTIVSISTTPRSENRYVYVYERISYIEVCIVMSKATGEWCMTYPKYTRHRTGSNFAFSGYS